MRYRLVTNERQGGAKGDGFLWRPLGSWDQSGTQTNPSPLVLTSPLVPTRP